MRNSYRNGILAGALALGNYVANPSEAYAQQPAKAPVVTDAGNDVGLLYPTEIRQTLSSSTPFKFYFSKDSAAKYTVRDAKKGLNALADTLDSRWYWLVKNNRDFRDYWMQKAKETQSSDASSVVRLNRALADDGAISHSEIFKEGKYQIKEGYYWVEVESKGKRKGGLVYLALPALTVPAKYGVPSTDTTKQTKDSTKSQLEKKISGSLTVVKDSVTPSGDTVEARKTYQLQTNPSPTEGKAKPKTQPVAPKYILKSTADSIALVNAYNAIKREDFVRDSVARATYNAVRDSLNKAHVRDSTEKAQRDSIANANKGSQKTDAPGKTGTDSTKQSYGLHMTLDGIVRATDQTNMSGGFFGISNDLVGVRVGYITMPDKVTKNIGPIRLSGGRYGAGTEKETNYGAFSAGFSGRIPLFSENFNMIVGWEGNWARYNVTPSGGIYNAQGVLLQPDASSPKVANEFSAGIWGGLQLGPVRAYVGQNDQRGKFAGVGLSKRLIRSHRPNNRK